MKKVLPIVLAAALTGGVIYTAITLLNDEISNEEVQQNKVTASRDETAQVTEQGEEDVVEDVVEEGEIMEPVPDFLLHEGQVGTVEKRDTGDIYITVGEGDNVYNLTWSPDYTKVFDNAGNEVTIEEGMQFTAYTSFNKPTILIYPPQYSPDVIVVHTEAIGTVEQTKLDATYLNFSGTVQFHIDDSVVIENLAGEKVTAAHIVEKNVLVFYGPTTRSIPAQATPSKIVLLNVAE